MITLAQLLHEGGAHVRMRAELAGYLVLLIAEAHQELPREVAPCTVLLGFDGKVTLTGNEQQSEALAVEGLRELLRELPRGAKHTSPAHKALCESAGGSMAEFQAALRRALIPLNRAASTRALTRWYRERQKQGGSLACDECGSDAVPAAAPTAHPPAAASDFEGPRSSEVVSAPLAAPEPSLLLSEVSGLSPSADRGMSSPSEAVGVEQVVHAPEPGGWPYAPRRSDVAQLLRAFRAEAGFEARQVARELRSLAGLNQDGLTVTPPPVGVVENAHRGAAGEATTEA